MIKLDTLVVVSCNKQKWYQADFVMYREDFKPTPFGVRLKGPYDLEEVTYWRFCEVVKSDR